LLCGGYAKEELERASAHLATAACGRSHALSPTMMSISYEYAQLFSSHEKNAGRSVGETLDCRRGFS
jgi:hypothetical protein